MLKDSRDVRRMFVDLVMIQSGDLSVDAKDGWIELIKWSKRRELIIFLVSHKYMD
jgi:hypothetical protein